DLNNILQRSRDNGIELIIQNYPYPYLETNTILQDFALAHDLRFVDQFQTFEKLENKDSFFVDSDHCTREGHTIMAKNVLKAILGVK
ncbi:MAG: hypothetical protein K8I00_02105, partial [Candidatus Omnitrophica bacterium]|nr:hypothetical protein [Candidatus Omnitrophota bacterium]